MNKHLAFLALSLVPLAPLARADYIATVTLDTSVLASNNPGQGPFAVDFQLNDGSTGDGVGNNTATISDFTLNGGSLTSGTESSSGASGDLNSGDTLSITDNGFYNDFNQQFTPGSSLSFTLDLTTNVSTSEGNGTGSPDQFSFTVYSNDFGSQASGLTIDITGPNPAVSSSGGSLGNGDSVPAPNVSAVPEPSTLFLFSAGMGLMAAGALRRKHRKLRAA